MRTALAKAAAVRIVEGLRSALTASTTVAPALRASASRLVSAAGIDELKGNAMPIVSAIDAMVEAVPIVLHVPLLRDMAISDRASSLSFGDRLPSSCSIFQMWVPDPTISPRYFPENLGPDDTTM